MIRLVLLPGMDGTGRLFSPLLAHLPSWLEPVIVSYPAQVAHSYAELLPLVEGALPPSEPFILLAESFSGPLAIMAAARHPHGLRGLILVASFARAPAPVLALARPLIRSWLAKVAPRALRWRLLLGGDADAALRADVESAIASVAPEVLAARAREMLGVDVTQELAAIRAPLLYIAAAGDALVPRRSWRLVERIAPEARLASIEGPHLILQVAPRECAAAIASLTAGWRR
jgi:pimeloyl-ACP methyl ester carboxylesterase